MGTIQQGRQSAESEIPQRDEFLLFTTVMGIQHQYASYFLAYENARPCR